MSLYYYPNNKKFSSKYVSSEAVQIWEGDLDCKGYQKPKTIKIPDMDDVQLIIKCWNGYYGQRANDFDLKVSVLYKGYLLESFADFANYVVNEVSLRSWATSIPTFPTIAVKIDKRKESVENCYAKAYEKLANICNLHEIWLYKQMLICIDYFEQYALENKDSEFYIYKLALLLNKITNAGKINLGFLETGKERLEKYAYEGLVICANKNNNNIINASRTNEIDYKAISMIKDFTDACRNL